MNSCPMTIENIEKYKLSNNQIKVFCKEGCSIICVELFEKKFAEKQELKFIVDEMGNMTLLTISRMKAKSEGEK